MSEHPTPEFLTVPDLVEMFGTTVSRVHRLLEDHVLIGMKIDGVFKVPTEFVRDGEPLSSLRGTVLALLDAGLTNDQAVEWLISENDELGARPIDTLLSGNKSAVRRATQSLAF